MAIVEVVVTLKPSLLDVQGATVQKALQQLGHHQVRQVRIGKHLTLDVDEALSGPALQQQVDLMCRQLLANPVIENYEITITSAAPTILPAAAVPVIPAVAPASPAVAASTVGSAGSVEPVTSAGGAPVTEPFAMDYASYDALPTEARLALQQAAWQRHEVWIRQQLADRRAGWVLCAGGEVIESGATMDSFPAQERLEQVGRQRNAAPLVFTLPR